ncbi:MAG TPA: hypothetical protein VG456_27940 [Candidatus Sulfopaludibacter sp.]|jgi:uncharacterized protein (TIGR03437 family)|nr:hypothetical protein [Candidatus Sulfopaludibacter sp.]
MLILLCAPAIAAPVLRLSTSALVWQPGMAATQTICSQNAGDGVLALSAASSASWLTVTVDAKQCLNFTIDVAGLLRSTVTASVTVSDAQAVDAPQVVTATVLVDGGEPVTVDQYLAPGAMLDIPFYTGDTSWTSGPSIATHTQDGGKWLAVSFYALGTLGYAYQTGYIHLAPPADMPSGAYSGSVTLNDYVARTIPVTLRVTTLPIAVPSASRVNVRLSAGGPATAYPFLAPITLTNSGAGTLTVQSVAAAGEGVTASVFNGAIYLAVDPASRAPGLYQDSVVTIACNAANCPLAVPVDLEVAPRGAPVVTYQGVLDNAAYLSTVAPGDVCILKGEQLSLESPALAGMLPLPQNLGGASVLVNDVYAPLYYSSYGQIAFQMPYGAAAGTALVRVERNGVPSNSVTVTVAATAAQIAAITDAFYQIRDATHPTRAGETLILWAIGLGATSPQVETGAAAPDPPAVAVVRPQVSFSGEKVTPTFAGLSSGSAGLYQVIVTAPSDLKAGSTSVSLGGNWVQVGVR